jgi:hypothetical protein
MSLLESYLAKDFAVLESVAFGCRIDQTDIAKSIQPNKQPNTIEIIMRHSNYQYRLLLFIESESGESVAVF